MYIQMICCLFANINISTLFPRYVSVLLNILQGLHLIIYGCFYTWQLARDNINLLPCIKAHFAFTLVDIKMCHNMSPYLHLNHIAFQGGMYQSVLLFTYKFLKLLQPCIILMINPLAMWQEIYLLRYWLSTIIYNLNICYQNSNHIDFLQPHI